MNAGLPITSIIQQSAWTFCGRDTANRRAILVDESGMDTMLPDHSQFQAEIRAISAAMDGTTAAGGVSPKAGLRLSYEITAGQE